MKKEIFYTQEEVQRNIEIFQKKEDDLINKRKEINKTLAHIKE